MYSKMNELLEFLVKIARIEICLILVIFASSIIAVPVDITTDLPVDLNVDPCNDFYEFTCAKFKRDHPIPEDKPTISQNTILNDLVHTKMKTLLEKPIDAGEIRPFQLAKSMYQACMDTKTIEANSFIVLEKIMKSIGSWPVTEGENWIADTFDWQTTAYQLFKRGFEYGNNMFFQVVVSSDPRNSTKFIINLSQPTGLVIPNNLMKNGWEEPVVRAYYEFMKKVAKKFGASQVIVEEEIKEVINLKIAISKITIPAEEKRNHSSTTNLMTMREVQEKYPYVNWLDFISYVAHPGEKKGHPDDVVNVNEPKYFKELKRIIEAQTQKNLANYMFWEAIVSVSSYMGDEMLNWLLEVKTLLNGMGKREPRWRECIVAIDSRFQVVYGALYVRNFFDVKTKTIVADMIHYMKNELEESIKTLDWMDDATKERALQKSKAMQEYIAYPAELLDDVKIENYYQELNIDPGNYLESMLNVTAMTTKLALDIDKSLSSDFWQTFEPTKVNAAYWPEYNWFKIQAGYLQGQFFSGSKPLGVNYGSIGMVIGHEIMHGFDDEGSQYDQNGNLVDWWKPETKEIFARKAKCIVDQYANFTVPEINIKLNGINTQGENIADNAAVKLAYLAYKKWAASHENGLAQKPYTPEQLFWIAFGIRRCSNEKAEQLKKMVLTDPHSPRRYRVNIPLMNSEYFAEDFKCPIGSPMNPENKCVVW